MRIQLELSDNSVVQVKDLMKEASIKTYSDVFSNALTLLIWAIKETRKGHTIVSANQEKEVVTELAMPVLDAVKPLPIPIARSSDTVLKK
ncbi:MAG TPA: hypothetical protein VGK01_12195 [Candidatus Angelobacter sp.]|jgi:hypothetical protein